MPGLGVRLIVRQPNEESTRDRETEAQAGRLPRIHTAGRCPTGDPNPESCSQPPRSAPSPEAAGGGTVWGRVGDTLVTSPPHVSLPSHWPVFRLSHYRQLCEYTPWEFT